MSLNTNEIRSLFDSTCGPLYFLLVSVFESREIAVQIIQEAYTQVLSANENATPQDIHSKAAELAYSRLGRPANTSSFSVDDMKVFFSNCERFDCSVPQEAVCAAQILERQVDELEPVSRLTVYLRMFFEMSPETIAAVSRTDEEAVSAQLFSAYRNIMSSSVQISQSSPLLQGLPVLQLIHLSLLKRKNSAKFLGNSEALLETVISSVIPAESELKKPDNTVFSSISNELITPDNTVRNEELTVSGQTEIPDFGADIEGFGQSEDLHTPDEKTSDISSADSNIPGFVTDTKEVFTSISETRSPITEDVYSGRDTTDPSSESTPDFTGFNIPENDSFSTGFSNTQQHYTQHTPPVPPEPKKKKNSGVIIGIAAGVAAVAIIAVIAILFSRGIIFPSSSAPENEITSSFDDSAVTASPAETTAPEETTAQPAIEAASIPLGTSTVTVDLSGSNDFIFRPSQSGYYAFVSEEYTYDLKAAIYSANGDLVTEDDDSASGNNFLAVTYCDAFTPITLSISDIYNTNVATTVTLSIYELDDSEGEALVTYQYYNNNGIFISNTESLYISTDIDSDAYCFNISETKYPATYSIDTYNRILWLSFEMSTSDQGKITVWYPTYY